MTKPRASLPSAIAYLVIGVVLTITLLYSFFVLAYAWVVEDNIFNRLVDAEAKFIEQQFEKTGEVSPPTAAFITLHTEWQDVPSQIADGYRRDPHRVEYTLNNGETFHIKVFDMNDIEYVLIADVAGFEVSRDYLPNLIRWLVGIALLCCLIVSSIAFAIARKITLPIKTLADHVQTLSADQKPTAFAHLYPDNELKQLASVVEHGFTELQSALQREKDFTRDVSHEIRTPISVIKNALDANRGTACIDDKAYDQVDRASSELEQVTNTLLALARSESAVTSSLCLNEVIEDALLNHFELNNTTRGLSLHVDVVLNEDVFVVANPNLMQILINNILSNIVRYATGSEVRICLDKDRAEFSNETAEPVPDNIQVSGIKTVNSPGIGHGLSLIERICQLNQWQLHTEYRAPKFILQIDFQAAS